MSGFTSGLRTSLTDRWATPQNLFDQLDREFHFTLDVCADSSNHKCERYFTVEDDGLSQEWTGRCFMNPPYGRSIGKWVKKAYDSAVKGALVVCLIPARTDTRWWRDYVMSASELRFIVGRVRFGNSDQNAPFPSAVVVFGPERILRVSVMEQEQRNMPTSRTQRALDDECYHKQPINDWICTAPRVRCPECGLELDWGDCDIDDGGEAVCPECGAITEESK